MTSKSFCIVLRGGSMERCKTKRHVIAMAAALVFALLGVACGGNGSQSAAPISSTPASQSQSQSQSESQSQSQSQNVDNGSSSEDEGNENSLPAKNSYTEEEKQILESQEGVSISEDGVMQIDISQNFK